MLQVTWYLSVTYRWYSIYNQSGNLFDQATSQSANVSGGYQPSINWTGSRYIDGPLVNNNQTNQVPVTGIPVGSRTEIILKLIILDIYYCLH